MIRLLCQGKVRKAYVKEGMDVFLKRLGKYSKVEYIEKNQFKESDFKGFTIALDVKGKELSSEKFADLLKRVDFDHSQITFFVGEAEGLPQFVLDACDMKISLSKMTFPNELVRLIFLEQLYRAYTIINNEPYHKT